MPRRKKQDIKVNNTDSLEGLMQEVYNDACSQINDAQRVINELTSSTTADDVDDATKIAKEKANALKVKDSGVKIKLEVAKLQADIIKHNGDIDATSESRTSSGAPSFEDFKNVREYIKNQNNEDEA